MLLTFTQIINLFGLATAVWLGIYVVTRNPRRLIAWLTALTLWSMAGLFLNVTLALNPPPTPDYFPDWLRLFLPFWNRDVLAGTSNHWLQGWSMTIGIAFWHHVTMLMRPGLLNRWRWTRILGAYVLAGVAVVIQAYTPYYFESVAGDPLYINTLRAGPFYLLFTVGLLLFTFSSLVNLIRSGQSAPMLMPRRQLYLLAGATLVAGSAGPIAIYASVFEVPIPLVVISLLLTFSVLMIGYGVANYSALMAGRTIRRDFFYNGLAIILVTSVYTIVAWLSVILYGSSPSVFILMVLLAIVTHSLLDSVGRNLDVLFYPEDVRALRQDLLMLTRQAGDGQALENAISLVFDSLCSSVRATFGLIFIFEDKASRVLAEYKINSESLPPLYEELLADDHTVLEFGRFTSPLEEVALLVPLYADTEQIGAVLLAHPENAPQFSDADIEFLLYPTDQLADALHNIQEKSRQLRQVSELLVNKPSETFAVQETVPVKEVENALRNLTDFSYLGDHSLAKLQLVRKRLPAGGVTHLDRGKGLNQVIADSIEKLRPLGEPQGDPPAREWYPYLILYHAYLEDLPNRDIMMRLYISEGTFNRTRRAALRAVARVIGELESGT